MTAGSLLAPLPWLAAPLAEALRTQRGHALLLHGPAGAGQFELAQLLAAAWLCEAETAGRSAGCGACAGCRLVAACSHPDLLVLLPDALRESLGWAATEPADAPVEAGSKAKPSREIKVAALRAAIAFAQTTASRGRAKVLLLHPAERLNAIAANTLLKTLEEPPGAARFILATAAIDRLLPTIRSRCQTFALRSPDERAAVDWLRAQGVAEPEVALAAAGGQPQEALARAAEQIDAAAWRQLPAWLLQGQSQPLAAWPLPRLVDALQKLCHDLMCRSVGAAPRYFPASVLPAGAELPALARWQCELQRAAEQVEHPLGAALLLESLLLQARRVLARPAAAQPHRSVSTTSPSLHWDR